MRPYVTRNVIHTMSISFVSNPILTLYIFVLTEFYSQRYSPHGISDVRYLFVRISGNGYLLNLRTPYLLYL